METLYKETTALSVKEKEDQYRSVKSVTFSPMREGKDLRIIHKKGDVVVKKLLFGLLGTKTTIATSDCIYSESYGDVIDYGVMIIDDKPYYKPYVDIKYSGKYCLPKHFDTNKEAFEYFEEVKRQCASVGNPMD